MLWYSTTRVAYFSVRNSFINNALKLHHGRCLVSSQIGNSSSWNYCMVSSPSLICQRAWKRTLNCGRHYATTTNDGEQRITDILVERFPGASVQVTDISGGCGDMYEIHVTSGDFAGKKKVQQHKLVTAALKAEIQQMHGLRIFTAAPKNT